MKPIDPAFIPISTAPRRVVDTGPAVRVTDGLANDQLLYLTSPSLLADDRRLVFISDRTGHPNLFLRDLMTGEQRQLSHNAGGWLKSYVYFDGTPYRGFGRASVSVDAARGIIYFIQGRQICCANAAGGSRVLAELPHGQMTAFTHVSADGQRLCVPTTDARCLDGDAQLAGKPAYDIDARIRAENLSSWLRVFDTESGKEILCERVPRAWVTHVQFSPRHADWILFNHEWPSECGIRRAWLWNGRAHTRLRTEGDGRKREDWTCHEMWERDGAAIIYHGIFADGPAYLGRVKPDGSERVEIPLPAGWKRYGHFTEGHGAACAGLGPGKEGIATGTAAAVAGLRRHVAEFEGIADALPLGNWHRLLEAEFGRVIAVRNAFEDLDAVLDAAADLPVVNEAMGPGAAAVAVGAAQKPAWRKPRSPAPARRVWSALRREMPVDGRRGQGEFIVKPQLRLAGLLLRYPRAPFCCA